MSKPLVATQFAHAVATVSATALVPNPNRAYAEFKNRSGLVIDLAFGATAVSGVGAVRIAPSGTSGDYYKTDYSGLITTISTASGALGVSEFYTI